jgi:hypothetical protein
MATRQPQPEPMERYRAKLNEIRRRTGLVTLKDLEDAGIGSKSTLSRIFRGEKRVPDDVLKALCRSARATPAELELLKNLRDEAFTSDGQAGEDANRDDDPSGVSDQGQALSAPGPMPSSSRMLRRRGARWAFAACVVLGLAAGVVIFTVQALDSSPSSNCVKYEVTVDGNLVNDAGKDIGKVFPEDVFIVDRSPWHPQLPYRYYGTVENQRVSGYVLQEKLDPLGPCA